jgi:hypothetical protein
MIVSEIEQGIGIMEQDVGIKNIVFHDLRRVRLIGICGRRAQEQV